jgi:hypothetical protein
VRVNLNPQRYIKTGGSYQNIHQSTTPSNSLPNYFPELLLRTTFLNSLDRFLGYVFEIPPSSKILTSQQNTTDFKYPTSKMQITAMITAFFLVALTNAFPVPPPEPWNKLTEHSPQVDQPKALGQRTDSRHLPNQHLHGVSPTAVDPLDEPKARNLPDHTSMPASPASTLESRDLISVLVCETIDVMIGKKDPEIDCAQH